MELVVRKADLLRELQLFQGIVERKNTIPILANVLIETDGDQVKLLATDLEVGLRSRCQASVSKKGSLTLPAKKLYEIIKALSDRSGGYYHPSPGMVYPALTYLEEIGYASVEAEGTRKRYTLTEAGRAHLDENRSVAETILAQLKWVGEKMGAMRNAFSSEADAGDAMSAKLRAARARVRAALIETRGASEEEQRRIAGILDRAADEIRRK